jgi:hypothetical protein
VKASGGVPVNTSSGPGCSTRAENVSAIASTSRWKCMVALGRPVVPEVNAISATSSAAVSAAVKPSGLASASAVRSPGCPLPYRTTGSPGISALSRSQVNRWSQSASAGRAISAMAASSPARSSGIVVTATAPALITPAQHATSQGLFGPRSSTRLPGTMPKSSVSTCATRLAAVSSSP